MEALESRATAEVASFRNQGGRRDEIKPGHSQFILHPQWFPFSRTLYILGKQGFKSSCDAKFLHHR